MKMDEYDERRSSPPAWGLDRKTILQLKLLASIVWKSTILQGKLSPYKV
jgi:hypothetical protein